MLQKSVISQTSQVAVLMTCYNRRNITLSCLESLYQQKEDFDVYLVDDGSTDGTAKAIQENYPEVKILTGDGSLFWVGGMRMAFAEALKSPHMHYLWLNDDTLLEKGAIANLLETYQALVKLGKSDSIVVGSVKDPTTQKLTYGGRRQSPNYFYHKFVSVEPCEEPQECDTMQGNIVLIPSSVAEKVGNVDDAYIHSLGDLDYGLRACQLGCSVWITPGYLGTCSQNTVQGSWVDMQLPVFERLKKAFHPKAFPIRAWTTFVQRYKGPFWFIYWFLPYLRAVVGYRNLSESPSFSENNS